MYMYIEDDKKQFERVWRKNCLSRTAPSAPVHTKTPFQGKVLCHTHQKNMAWLEMRFPSGGKTAY
jgi:hypothetical protein